jgi:hypothetical protein
MKLFPSDSTSVVRKEDDRLEATVSFQSPPRSPRNTPGEPARSFHSYTLPLWSNVP